jgi:hypothetical protein
LNGPQIARAMQRRVCELGPWGVMRSEGLRGMGTKSMSRLPACIDPVSCTEIECVCVCLTVAHSIADVCLTVPDCRIQYCECECRCVPYCVLVVACLLFVAVASYCALSYTHT